MPEPQGWVHARIDWGGHLDTGTAPALRPDAIHIATWPITPFDTTETDCYRVGDQIWIWQPGVGAAHFSLDEHRLHAHPWPGSDSESFRRIVVRSWLPAVYPLWGRQVLHASGLVCPSTGDAVAFTGPTYAGKSTTAYGVSRLGVWQLLSDDTIGFTLGDGTNRLHPLPNETRLRPDSATYHAVPSVPGPAIEWPDRHVSLRVAYVLEGVPNLETTAEFTLLRAAEAVPLLLQEAFTLSFELPKYNQQLMKDYLALASTVPTYRLRYRRSFDAAAELYSTIQDHLAGEVGLTCPADEPG